MNQPETASVISSSAEVSSAEYFAQRQLKQGTVGWLLLIGLGVAYVISGDFAGWNFGIAQGGWGGMFIATALAALMYLCLCLSMSEMSTMMPTAGGGYSFARAAFGPFGGYLTGTAILIEYAIAPAAIAVFIGGYCESLFGINGWMIYLACYAIFMGIHLKGAGEALKIMFAITLVAAVALVVFIVAMIPHFNAQNLFDIPVGTGIGASSFLPHGYLGIWAAVPFAIWFFLAVEGVPLAAEEAKDPAKDSMGIYYTWNAYSGCLDAKRNCISNVRSAGLSIPVAVQRLIALMKKSKQLGFSGVNLKDEHQLADIGLETTQKLLF